MSARGRRSKAELIGALGLAFRQEQNRGQAFDELAAERLGINLTDLRCVDVIEQHGRLTAGELADAAQLTTGAVTAVLDRLERAGYARRIRDEADRRRVQIELTDEAREATRRIWAPVGEAFFALLGRYSVAELEVMLDMLDRSAEVQAELLDRLRGEG